MAMNKKEQASMGQLRLERDMARALSWPTNPIRSLTYRELDAEMEAQGIAGGSHMSVSRKLSDLFIGWTQNAHSRTIEPAAYDGMYICRGYSDEGFRKGTLSWSHCTPMHDHPPLQESGIYRTERDAIIALLHELQRKAAKEIAPVIQRLDDLDAAKPEEEKKP
jgi:hypothetical protein